MWHSCIDLNIHSPARASSSSVVHLYVVCTLSNTPLQLASQGPKDLFMPVLHAYVLFAIFLPVVFIFSSSTWCEYCFDFNSLRRVSRSSNSVRNSMWMFWWCTAEWCLVSCLQGFAPLVSRKNEIALASLYILTNKVAYPLIWYLLVSCCSALSHNAVVGGDRHGR